MEFWEKLENIYPRDGVNYLILRHNVLNIRNLFGEYKSQINENVKNYLTFLQQNHDLRVYYFLEGLKDGIYYFPNSQSRNKYYSIIEAENLVDHFSLESRKQWTYVLYQSTTNCKALLTVLAVYPNLTAAAGAIYGWTMVLY